MGSNLLLTSTPQDSWCGREFWSSGPTGELAGRAWWYSARQKVAGWSPRTWRFYLVTGVWDCGDLQSE